MTATASTAQSVAEAHQRLRADPDIQFSFPPPKPPPEPSPVAEWLANLLSGLPNLGWLFYAMLIAGAVILVVLLVRWIARRRADASVVATDDQAELRKWRPEEQVARALLSEAEALAAEGRYDEATHLLLQRSVEDIRERRPTELRPALTSREIARMPALPGVVRDAFARMAAPVERSLFGGRTLSREAWEEARAAYRSFALPEAWQ